MSRPALLLASLLLLASCSSGSSEEPWQPIQDVGGGGSWGDRDGSASTPDQGTAGEDLVAPPGDTGDDPIEDAGGGPEDTGSVSEDTGGEDPLDDDDNDGVPNVADRWPDDDSKPGRVTAEYVYAHTADELYKIDVKIFTATLVGPFVWPAEAEENPSMTDIAIDKWGVIYGVSFESLFTCHAETAVCTFLGNLPDDAWFNGLTFVPGALFGAEDDVLIGISQGGRWFRLDLSQNPVGSTVIGEYLGYTSSGDAYSVVGLGTFAAIEPDGGGDPLVAPVVAQSAMVQANGRIILDSSTSCNDVYGLAGWNEKAFAFCANGTVVVIDVETATVLQSVTTNTDELLWYGAGTVTEF